MVNKSIFKRFYCFYMFISQGDTELTDNIIEILDSNNNI